MSSSLNTGLSFLGLLLIFEDCLFSLEVDSFFLSGVSFVLLLDALSAEDFVVLLFLAAGLSSLLDGFFPEVLDLRAFSPLLPCGLEVLLFRRSFGLSDEDLSLLLLLPAAAAPPLLLPSWTIAVIGAGGT